MHRFKNEYLLDLWLQGVTKDEKFAVIFNYVRQRIKEKISLSNEQNIKNKILRLCLNFDEIWSQSHRRIDFFKKKNSAWLKGDFIIEIEEPKPSTSSGRPRLLFSKKIE